MAFGMAYVADRLAIGLGNGGGIAGTGWSDAPSRSPNLGI